MRRRITWVVAATTSAVVLVFVIPLALLVRSLAEDRGMAVANEEARNVALLVSSLHGTPQLPELVSAVDERSPARTSVVTAGGEVLGTQRAGLEGDPDIARARGGQAFTRMTPAGAKILVPVVTPAGTDVVRTTVGADVLHAGVSRAWLALAGLGLVLIVAAMAIAAQLGRRISTPVTDVAEVAHRLREGDLEARAVQAGPPETQELAQALNRLAERIVELLVAERAAVGDLSHRLRTPVTALRLDADAVADPTLAERLQQHIWQLQRTIDAIVREARRPVRSDMPAGCDATAVVGERVAFWSALAEDQGRRFDVDLPTTPRRVAIEAADLADIVDVLVDNVFAHTPEGTALSVTLTGPDERPVLRVTDEGPGMQERPPGAPERAGFTGLGLQIVRRAVKGFGGGLALDSAPGRGTRVEVRLPSTGAGPRLGHGQSSLTS